MAVPVPNIIVLPTPWRTRNAISRPTDDATPQRRDATVKSATPRQHVLAAVDIGQATERKRKTAAARINDVATHPARSRPRRTPARSRQGDQDRRPHERREKGAERGYQQAERRVTAASALLPAPIRPENRMSRPASRKSRNAFVNASGCSMLTGARRISG